MVALLKFQARFGEEEHLILDAVAKGKRIFVEMRRRPLHVDVCIQNQIRASNPGCIRQGIIPVMRPSDHSSG